MDERLRRKSRANYSREWRKANPEKQRLYKRRYYAKHRERELEKFAIYRQANRERLNKRSRDYYHAHRHERSSYTREYRTTHNGRLSYRRAYMKWKYGITPEQLVEMEQAQSGLCALCGKPPSEKKRLHVDHCHGTKRVRALLCNQCNVGLGAFRDNPNLLRAAADYVESHNSVAH